MRINRAGRPVSLRSSGICLPLFGRHRVAELSDGDRGGAKRACPHGLPRRYCRHTRCLPAYGLRREIMGLLMISTDRDVPAFPHFPGPVISPRIRTLTLVWLLGLHTRRHCGGERCAGCCCAGCHHQRTSLPRRGPTATDGVALRPRSVQATGVAGISGSNGRPADRHAAHFECKPPGRDPAGRGGFSVRWMRRWPSAQPRCPSRFRCRLGGLRKDAPSSGSIPIATPWTDGSCTTSAACWTSAW